jgi:hypothetical protein
MPQLLIRLVERLGERAGVADAQRRSAIATHVRRVATGWAMIRRA